MNLIRILFAFYISWPLTGFCSSPEDYYSTALGLQGKQLKSQLHKIIDDHRVIKYTQSGNNDWYDHENMDVWEALVFADSACALDQPFCGEVQLLYLNETRHISQANRGSGANDSWDREHVWPKSRGFKNQSQDGYSDLHHIRPADRNINGKHSNYGYDEGGEPVMDKLVGGDTVLSGAYLDKLGKSFEPTNRAKGQVARMLFYMAVRYEIGDNGGSELMPDLILRDHNDKVKEPWIGDLCTLLNWHERYPVTPFEQRRNDRVFEIQKNRNPFIDHPGWAGSIWGRRCNY